MSAITIHATGTMPHRQDRTRNDVARERSIAKRQARAARTPLPLNMDRLADELHTEWGAAR